MHIDPRGNTPQIEGGPLLAARYRLLEKIGEGGAAEVFRATDERLGRTVAVKVLRPQYTADTQSRRRFEIEARAAAALRHPNIIDVYDFGEGPGGSMFMVMQYVEGGSLKDVLEARGRLPIEDAVTIALGVCSALSVAHAEGLIHRDVKPQNILISKNGEVALTDFGVVKALSGPSLTQSGMTFGTAAYLSPEQATGSPIGPESDIYALGCVMYEMLAGAPPFTGDNPAVVAYKQVWEQPRPLHDLAPEAPPSIEAVVMRCLSKDPAGRYPSAAALAADLESVLAHGAQPTSSAPQGALGYAPADRRWTPIENRPQAEVSQPLPMPAVPPVKASVSNTAPTTVNPAVQRALDEGVPGPAAYASTPDYAQQRPPPYAPTTSYPPARPGARGVGAPPPPTIVAGRRGRGGFRWLPLLLLLVALLAACGLFSWLNRASFPLAINLPQNTPAPRPTSTSLVASVQASPTAQQGGRETPRPTETAQPTATTAPPTETSEPPPPSATPEPPPPTPTNTPVTTAGSGSLTLDDNAFTGGYTRSDGTYHRRTAQWVYGQGTPYHTMTAAFNLDQVPGAPARLVIVGVDSEDPAKTPIRIVLNGVVIYEGADPLPDDSRAGPGGQGNWGAVVFDIPPGALQPGANTLSITNLDPSDKVNYPIFFMLDYAQIVWGEGGD